MSGWTFKRSVQFDNSAEIGISKLINVDFKHACTLPSRVLAHTQTQKEILTLKEELKTNKVSTVGELLLAKDFNKNIVEKVRATLTFVQPHDHPDSETNAAAFSSQFHCCGWEKVCGEYANSQPSDHCKCKAGSDDNCKTMAEFNKKFSSGDKGTCKATSAVALTDHIYTTVSVTNCCWQNCAAAAAAAAAAASAADVAAANAVNAAEDAAAIAAATGTTFAAATKAQLKACHQMRHVTSHVPVWFCSQIIFQTKTFGFKVRQLKIKKTGAQTGAAVTSCF